MRIVISAPRKSGGAYLRCLLGTAYDAKNLGTAAPTHTDPAAITAWITSLPPKSVTTCDLRYADLAGPASDSEVRLIGVIRHPFDLFVSNYDVAQQRAARGRDDDHADHGWSILSGEDLDSAVTEGYAATGFASEVSALREWTDAGKAIRYEELISDPAAVLRSLSLDLGPLTDEQVEHARGLCPAENVVLSRPGRGRRMPSLEPDTWRERLPAALLATLRERFGADVTALGYDAS